MRLRLSDDDARKRTLLAGKTEEVIWDDKLTGFGLRIRSSGVRTWIVQYRNAAGFDRKRTLGKTKVLSADLARKAAKIELAKVALKEDPHADRKDKKEKAQQSFEVKMELYLAQQNRIKDGKPDPKWRPRSFESVDRHLRVHWQPLHRKSIYEITRRDVADLLLAMAAKRGEGAARRARSTLSAFFDWVMRAGTVLQENPVFYTKAEGKDVPRNRVLTELEIASIWKHSGADHFGNIVKLLVLTAQRRDEVGHMLRAELDIDDRLWTIGSERSKNHQPHDVPLSDLSIEILNGIEPRKRSDYVFGVGKRGFSGWARAKAALDKRIAQEPPNWSKSLATGKRAAKDEQPFAKPWVLHDLRRSTATHMAELGTLPHVVEAITNHMSGSKAGVAGIYNRATYLPQKRQALDLWAAHLHALINGKSAKVVDLQTKRA